MQYAGCATSGDEKCGLPPMQLYFVGLIQSELVIHSLSFHVGLRSGLKSANKKPPQVSPSNLAPYKSNFFSFYFTPIVFFCFCVSTSQRASGIR